jgi:hypothetical protein
LACGRRPTDQPLRSARHKQEREWARRPGAGHAWGPRNPGPPAPNVGQQPKDRCNTGRRCTGGHGPGSSPLTGTAVCGGRITGATMSNLSCYATQSDIQFCPDDCTGTQDLSYPPEPDASTSTHYLPRIHVASSSRRGGPRYLARVVELTSMRASVDVTTSTSSSGRPCHHGQVLRTNLRLRWSSLNSSRNLRLSGR